MEHVEWFKSLPQSPSISAAARKAHIQKTTLMRQLDRGEIPAENVIALCRVFGKSPADGLVETGYLDPSDFDGAGVTEALEQATNQQILDEIAKRLGGGSGEIFLEDAEVPVTPSNIDSRRKAKTAESVDAALPDWQERYVADTSPEELFPGDDGYGEGP